MTRWIALLALAGCATGRQLTEPKDPVSREFLHLGRVGAINLWDTRVEDVEALWHGVQFERPEGEVYPSACARVASEGAPLDVRLVASAQYGGDGQRITILEVTPDTSPGCASVVVDSATVVAIGRLAHE